MWKWLLAVIVLGALGFATVVYVWNVSTLGVRHPVTARPALPKGDARRGRHLADITGCTDCHRGDLRGGLFADDGWLHGRYYASNLTRKAKQYSDADLERIVREGVRPDGRGVMAMPAMGFVRLTDEEMADIIAFVRSMPAGGDDQPDHFIGPLDQWDLWRVHGPKPAYAYVADERTKSPPDAGPEHATARHLAGIVCAECHGGDLQGNGWDSGAPDLRVVASYSAQQFERLLRTGVAADGKERGLMTHVARGRLHKLDDAEIAALYAYLTEVARRH